MESVSSLSPPPPSILKQITERSNRVIAMKCHKELLLTQEPIHPQESFFLRSVRAIRYPDSDMFHITRYKLNNNSKKEKNNKESTFKHTGKSPMLAISRKMAQQQKSIY